MLPLLVPRYYSISSSPLEEPGRCSITVAVVEGPARSGRGDYRGVCSSYLAGQGEGSSLHALVKETKAAFRLPDDPRVPIIMIGPGTGLAPFRGFLQERAVLKARGQTLGAALLFFGCRHPQQDFLYADELRRFAAEGATDLHVAFSRHDGTRTYVQDLIAKNKDQTWSLVEDGAVIYVCGDGGRMEPDVKRALTDIYAEKSSADAAAAAAWIEKLGTTGRYALDVWATN